MPSSADVDKSVWAAAERALGCPIERVERLGGGRNSCVRRLFGADGRRVIAKRYYRHPKDRRNRMRTEVEALRFLSRHGVEQVPAPLGAAPDDGWALYEDMGGADVEIASLAPADIDDAVAFLGSLWRLRGLDGAAQLPNASEACFSLHGILGQLDARSARLQSVEAAFPLHDELRAFLADELGPAVNRCAAWATARLAGAGVAAGDVISTADRTLSPSDFGFHNARRLPDGSLAYVDFEYFGWDDPAKMLSDFVLHPAMSLRDDLKQRFVQGALVLLSRVERLPLRLGCVYPLWGIKWCLILLNEFLPTDLERRRFASETAFDPAERRSAQLVRSRALLRTVLDTYEKVPYGA